MPIPFDYCNSIYEDADNMSFYCPFGIYFLNSLKTPLCTQKAIFYFTTLYGKVVSVLKKSEDTPFS